jgi:hypothetical protein
MEGTHTQSYLGALKSVQGEVGAAGASAKRTFIQTSVKDTESICAWPLVSL